MEVILNFFGDLFKYCVIGIVWIIAIALICGALDNRRSTKKGR